MLYILLLVSAGFWTDLIDESPDDLLSRKFARVSYRSVEGKIRTISVDSVELPDNTLGYAKAFIGNDGNIREILFAPYSGASKLRLIETLSESLQEVPTQSLLGSDTQFVWRKPIKKDFTLRMFCSGQDSSMVFLLKRNEAVEGNR